MRPLLAAAVVLAAILAGCTAGDDPTPPNADPNGSKTFPPLPDSNSTGPPTGTVTGSATASASASATTTAPTSFGPHDQEDSASDASYPGLGVSGHLTGSGSALRVEAAANDFGERTYRVPDGKCAQPFTESMRGPDGQTVLPRAPPQGCDGFGLKDLQPGDDLAKSLEWNGTLWDSASGAYVRAPVGTYTWQVTFHVYPGNASGPNGGAAMTLEFHATVR